MRLQFWLLSLERRDDHSTRPRHSCKDNNNIKMALKEVECVDVDWIYLAEDRDWWRAFVNKAINVRVHKRWGI